MKSESKYVIVFYLFFALMVFLFAGCPVDEGPADIAENIEAVIVEPWNITIGMGDTFQLTARVFPRNSDQRVSWSSDNEGVVMVGNDGRIEGTGTGTANITAASVKDPDIKGHAVVIVTDVRLESLRLDPETLALKKYESKQLEVIASPEGASNEVLWASEDETVAFVNSDGSVVGREEGSTTITATSRFSGDISATCRVTVSNEIGGAIQVDPVDSRLFPGDSITLSATLGGTVRDDVEWTSLPGPLSGYISLTQDGKVTALKPATVVVTATLKDNPEIFGSAIVHVLDYSLSISQSSMQLLAGEEGSLSVTLSPYNAPDGVSWEADDPEIVSIVSEGLTASITGIKGGETIVRARSTADPSKKTECSITVEDIVITLSPPSVIMIPGAETDITAVFSPVRVPYQEVIWSTGVEGIVNITNQTGLSAHITATGLGTVTVTAAWKSDPAIYTAIQIIVKQIEVTLSSDELQLIPGRRAPLTATVVPETLDQGVKWESDNKEVADVVDGEVTALAVGTARITAVSTHYPEAVAGTCEVTVLKPEIYMTPLTREMFVGDTFTCIMIILPVKDNVEWTSNNTGVATVSPATGEVTARSAGTATITGRSTVDPALSASCTVTVYRIKITLTPSSFNDLAVGDTMTISAAIEPASEANRQIIWTSDNPGKATVESTGPRTAVVTAVNAGAGGIGYIGIKAALQNETDIYTYYFVTVVDLYPNLDVTLSPETIFILTEEAYRLQVAVTPEGMPPGIEWDSSNESAVEVDGDGMIKGIGEGTSVITARSAVKNQESDTCTVSVTSNKLIRGEQKVGDCTYNSVKWYYFNGATGCHYELHTSDRSNASRTAEISVSAFREDKVTPYFTNQTVGIHQIDAAASEKVYIKIERTGLPGDFALSYSFDYDNPPATWTIMMYMNADNNLESDMLLNLKELITGYHEHCGINVVVLLDKKLPIGFYGIEGTAFSDSRLFLVNETGLHRLSGAPEFPEITLSSSWEVNMGDAYTLKKFITFCKHNFPARHDALIITGHGYGPAGFCGDDSSGGDRLHVGEMSFYLDDKDAVSLLGFNTCYMGNIETAYQFRYDGDPESRRFQARCMLGSPNAVDPLGWTYDKMLGRIDTRGGTTGETETLTGNTEAVYRPSELDPDELGLVILEEQRDFMYKQPGDLGDRDKLTCYDLAFAEEVKDAVNALAVSLKTHNEKAIAEDVRDTSDTVLPYYAIYPAGSADDALERTYLPLYELLTLCEAIKEDGRFNKETTDACTLIETAVGDLIRWSYYGKDTSNTYGLSIFFSNGDDLYPPSTGEPMFSSQWWYNAKNVESDSRNTKGQKFFGEFDWCRENAAEGSVSVENWFELLDYWYDPQGNPATGGVNKYQY